jgi:hypothetical protein
MRADLGTGSLGGRHRVARPDPIRPSGVTFACADQPAKGFVMPTHDQESSPAGGVSRRTVIRGAATAGVAGLAVTALGGALSPAATASTGPSDGSLAAAPAGGVSAPAGPIVVHVRNAASGDIEVFSGTSQTRLRDKDLAARITRAIG